MAICQPKKEGLPWIIHTSYYWLKVSGQIVGFLLLPCPGFATKLVIVRIAKCVNHFTIANLLHC